MTDRVPRRITWAVDQLDVRPSHRVLEIGCGGGPRSGSSRRATDAGTLARELDAWTDLAQQFVSPAA